VSASINDEFIASGAFAETVLHDGDSVELLYFMGGGGNTIGSGQNMAYTSGRYQ